MAQILITKKTSTCHPGKVGLASEVVGEDSQCVVRRVSGE